MFKTKPKNALSHGLYTRDVVLPWESEEEFNDHHQMVREEFDPDGPFEEAAVFDIAHLLWKKRRLEIGSQLAYRAHPDAAALAEAGKDGWEGVAVYLRGSAGAGDRVSDSMRALAKSHATALVKLTGMIDAKLAHMASPPSAGPGGSEANHAAELDRLIILTKELTALGSSTIVPALELVENYDLEQQVLARAYRPQLLEQNLKLTAMIDKQLEKAVTRLVQGKEIKKLYGKQQVMAIPSRPAKSEEEA